jgi:hypothetical protein
MFIMNRLLTILILFIGYPVFSQTSSSTSKLPAISNVASFKHGEELKYVLRYGFITGGTATISSMETKLGDTNVFHSSAVAQTTGLVDKLFKVYDIYESYYTMDSNMPVKAVRNIREGSYKYYDEVTFNRKENLVVSQKSGKHKVPDKILDMVSAFFYMRRIDFSKTKVNDIIYFDTFFGDELFPFSVIYKGKEEIKTDAGKFKCLKFLPIVEPGRIFKENDDMLFWLSDDENKIPVLVKFDMIVGSFKCELTSFKNLKYETKALIPKK